MLASGLQLYPRLYLGQICQATISRAVATISRTWLLFLVGLFLEYRAVSRTRAISKARVKMHQLPHCSSGEEENQ